MRSCCANRSPRSSSGWPAYGSGAAVPVMVRICVFPGVAAIVNVVLKVPVPSVCGLKTREMVQLALPASSEDAGGVGQSWEAIAKFVVSASARARGPLVCAFTRLLSTTACGVEVVPTGWAEKLIDGIENASIVV